MAVESQLSANIRRGRRFIITLLVILIGLTMAWMVHLLSQPSAMTQATFDILQPENSPSQTSLEPAETAPIHHRTWFTTWTATPRAAYSIDARVLSTHRYVLDLYSRFSPIDYALAWGSMHDPQVDAWITWDQYDRWYYYHIPEAAPYELTDVRDHSANVHIIPANDQLEDALLHVEPGDTIRLEGRLVDIDLNLLGIQFEMSTSLTRQDAGAGACEILYVEMLVVDGLEYR